MRLLSVFFAALIVIAASPPTEARERQHDEIAKMSPLESTATAPTVISDAVRVATAPEVVVTEIHASPRVGLPSHAIAAFERGLCEGYLNVRERMNRVRLHESRRSAHRHPIAFASRIVPSASWLDRDLQRRS